MTRSCLAVLLAAAAARTAAAQQAEPAKPQEAADQPVTRREIEDLRRQIVQETRPSLELLFDGHGETGDLNNELGFWRYGARLNLRLGSSKTLQLSAQRTHYEAGGGVLEAVATGGTLVVRAQLSERREGQLELSVTRFDDAWSLTGQASLAVRPSPAARFAMTMSRSNVEESLLSVAGLVPVLGPFAGERVGAVRDSRLIATGDYRLPWGLEVFGEVGVGVRDGDNAGSNFFKRAGGGLGYTARVRPAEDALSLLRLSLSFEYFGFDEDRLGYGGASLLDARGRPVPTAELGSDGLSPVPSAGNPGVGGYFSPARYWNGVLRLEARGRLSPRVEYGASGFLGTQSFTGAEARQASGVAARLTIRLTERVSLPLAYAWNDFGPFAQQSLLARLVVLF